MKNQAQETDGSQKGVATENSAKDLSRNSLVGAALGRELLWEASRQNASSDTTITGTLFSWIIDITTIFINNLLDPAPFHHSFWIQGQNAPEQRITC